MISELAGILSADRIITDVEMLRKYSTDLSFAQGAAPQAIVEPVSTEELQKLVRWANERKVALTPVSSGEPHFRGDTVPAHGGIVVDLRRMNRILRLDRRNRVALIEPGVTFAQLLPELKKEGLRLLMPPCPRGNKSVVASCLERTPGTMPRFHIDISEPLLCLEVVFGTGDVFKTGEAAGPGSIEEQWQLTKVQKWDAGPGQVDLRRLVQGAQGGLGIVTWGSIRCEVMPSIQKLLVFPVKDPAGAVDFVQRITRRKLGDEILLLNDADLAAMLGGTAKPDRIKGSLPPWALFVAVAGLDILPEERVSYQEADITEIARQFGLAPVAELAGVDGNRLLDLLNSPSPEPYWKLRGKGASTDVFFLTTLDKAPGFVDLVCQSAEAGGYRSRDIGVYVQPIQQGRGCHCEFTFPYSPEDADEVARLNENLRSVVQAVAKGGGFFSVLSHPWTDALQKDAASQEAVRKVKGIFDPSNIMNPGKIA